MQFVTAVGRTRVRRVSTPRCGVNPIPHRFDGTFGSTLRLRDRLPMLHRNMKTEDLRLSLEDVLADLWHARRNHDLGRLALLSYCDMRRWARVARREGLAQRSHDLVLSCPYASRERFLSEVDALIAEAEGALHSLTCAPASSG